LNANIVFKERVFLQDMKQEVCVLPVRCKGCNVVFDLWHGLLREAEIEIKTGVYESSEVKRFLDQHFCWHCRQIVAGEQDNEEQEELEFSLTFA
jgi:hypothetical protein